MAQDSNPNHWHMPRALVFVTVLQEGSLSAAARKLNLSKSVVSSHLRQLEQVCGARLLERSSRKLRLTEAGALFLPHAQRMFQEWNRGLEKINFTQEEPTGTLTITASSLHGRLLVIPVVKNLLGQHPKLTVKLTFSDTIVDLLEEFIDVAIRTGPLTNANFCSSKLGDDLEIIVGAPELLERWGSVTHPKQLTIKPWVAHSIFFNNHIFHGPNQEQFSLTPDVRASSETGESYLELILAGLGLGVVPRLLVNHHLESGRLQRVLPLWRSREVHPFAIYPSQEFLPPKVSVFIEEMKHIIQQRNKSISPK